MAIPRVIDQGSLGTVVMAFTDLSEEKKQALLTCARDSIGQALAGHWQQTPPEFAQGEEGAVFVTLKIQGELRGCIGSLEARQPLLLDVWQNAYNAAFRDPRFPPVTENEFGQIRIEISVLTPAVALSVKSEQDLLNKLHPGFDGVILEDGAHRATFLPAVWETLPKAEDFLLNLKRKAGLPDNYWSHSIRCSVYHAIKCAE